MVAAFWSGLGGELAKQWAARVLTPAFVFWTGGLALVWWSAHGSGVQRHGWAVELRSTAHPIEQLSTTAQVILIVGALVLIAGSALLAERITLPLLKLLEGYWPRPVWLRGLLVSYRRRRRSRRAADAASLQIKQLRGALTLAQGNELRALEAMDALTSSQRVRLAELDRLRRLFTAAELAKLGRASSFLRRTPIGDSMGMPTRLGDVLRAAEQRPLEKYGMDPVACWYALWILLPQDMRTEIYQARLELDRAARTWLWGALFLVWSPWLWWVAVPLGVLVPLVTYNVSMLPAAALFGDLSETAFDLYRTRLYDALRLPLPASPAEERVLGHQLSAILWRGETNPAISYIDPAKRSADDAQ